MKHNQEWHKYHFQRKGFHKKSKLQPFPPSKCHVQHAACPTSHPLFKPMAATADALCKAKLTKKAATTKEYKRTQISATKHSTTATSHSTKNTTAMQINNRKKREKVPRILKIPPHFFKIPRSIMKNPPHFLKSPRRYGVGHLRHFPFRQWTPPRSSLFPRWSRGWSTRRFQEFPWRHRHGGSASRKAEPRADWHGFRQRR